MQADNFVSHAIGGVKLQVYEQDVNKSLEILKLFNITKFEPLEPEKFVAVIDDFTKKIPLIGKISLANRSIILIVLGMVLIYLLVFLMTK